MNIDSPWLTTYGYSSQGGARIFAFPYSGAGTSIYSHWAKDFCDSHVDFIGVQLPGRESRFGEMPISHLPLLVKELSKEIAPLTNQPFIFFGHSLGALIAFELCRELRRKKLSLPIHLFVSGFRPPQLSNPNKELHQLPEKNFIEGIREYGNTREEVLLNKILMDMLLPMLRADFCLNETYQYQQEVPLPCPITVLKGDNDSFAKPEQMFHWQQETSANFEEVTYTGGHFFLNEHQYSISQKLGQAF